MNVPELLKPIEDQFADPPSQPTPLADAARAFATERRDDFLNSMKTVASVNPDAYGQATQVSRFSGIPADILHKNADQMRSIQLDQRYAAIADRYQKTANALRNGNLAAVSHDDVEQLIRIEGAASDARFNEQSTGEQLLNAVRSSWLSMQQAGAVARTDDLTRLKSQFDAVDSELAKAEREGRQPYGGLTPAEAPLSPFAREYLLATPDQRQEMRLKLLDRQTDLVTGLAPRQEELQALPVDPGQRRAQELQDAGVGSFSATVEALGENPGYAVRTAVGATASSAPMLAAGVAGGIPAAAAVEFGTEYNAKLLDVLQEAKVDLKDPKAVLAALQDEELMTQARARAARKAAGTTAVDIISMKLAGRLLAPANFAGKPLTAAQREAANVLVQVPVQAATEGASEAAGQFAADQKVDAGQVLLEAVAGGAHSTTEVATFSYGRIYESLSQGLKDARQAREGKRTLDEMVDATVNGKTRGRDPGTFRDIAAQGLAGSPVEQVWLPADQLQRLNQDGKVDLQKLFDSVPGLQQQYEDAEARGGSVSMKTADYLTWLSDYHDQLGDTVRINADGMSVDDAKAWNAEQEENLRELQDQLSRAPDAQREAFDDTVGQLIAAGFRRQDAEQYAALHTSVLTSLAERTGQAVEQIRQQFPLAIGVQAPEQLRRIPVTEAELAIQRLRKGEIPQPADMFGKSLGEYLRDSGGVNDAGGELAALDLDTGKVGRNRITRKEGGRSLDDAAMAAWERGYFPGIAREDVTPQLLVDALQQEQAGNPRFSAEQENATLRDQAQTLNTLQEYFDRLGVNLAEISDEQALAMLRDPNNIQGERLAQSDLERALSMSEDDYIKAVNPTGKTSDESDIVTVHIGDLDRPSNAKKVSSFKDSSGANVDVYADSNGTLYAEQNGEVVGQIEERDGETLNIVAQEVQGKGIGTGLAAEMIRRNPFAQAGSFSPAGERTRRAAFRRLKAEQRLNQGGDNDTSRGFITFSPRGTKDRRFQITLGADRDLSTVLHELGHFYLEAMQDLADQADGPAQIKADVQTIREWVGAEGDAPLTTEQHEQFARGFENYLAEGKAPSVELSGAFARFKRWLIQVYKDLRRLNVELSEPVRRVFDRLVATDEQIQQAEQVTAAIPLFADAKKAGMTDAEFQAYQNSIDIAHADARDAVEEEIVREEERRRSAFWSEKSAEMRQLVSEEIDTLPEYAALKALRQGVMPDGTEAPIKMNSAELTERYGRSVGQRLAFTHSKTGQPIDVVADMLGFQSGDQMIKALLGTPSRAEAIKQETERRMEATYGPRTTGEAAERAVTAVHNERRADVLAKELRRLAEVGNRNNVTSQQILKEAARRVMSGRKVRDIAPAEFQRAEAKAGREAFQAFTNGDLEAAYEAKQRQLLNFYLYREAVKARDQIEKIVDRMSTYNRQSKRQKLGKAGKDYLDQIDNVMEQYEFRRVSLRDLDRRQSFLAWYQEQLAAGVEPIVPEFLLNTTQRVNYRELTLDQLQELDEFVGNVDHLARLKNKLIANKRVRDFDEARSQLTGSAYENNKKRRPPPIDKNTRSMLERIGDTAGEFSAALIKMEQIVEWLDGGDINGPWSTIFWQPFVDAQVRKDDLNREFGIKMTSLVDEFTRDRGAKVMQQRYDIPSIGGSLTHNAVLAAALNMGNASNRKKLLNGGHNGKAWTEAQLADITQHMTQRDWEFVQSMWDLVEGLWPQIEQLERELNGVPPAKVEAVPVQTPFGEFRGGYWPLVYDTSTSAYAQVQNQLGNEGGLFEQGYARATTPKGHTKARVDAFAAPILLDVSIVASHLGQVIHDLTHRTAIRDAAKIIGDRQIKQSLIDTLGPAVANQFNPWLQGVANDMVLDSQKGIDAWTKFVGERLRANAAIAWMGFSATTGLQQILGYSQAFEYFTQKGGKRYIFQGMHEFLRHPFDTIKLVNEMSGEMRNRAVNLDRDMRSALKQLQGRKGYLQIVQRLAFQHIGVVQSMVDYPTWLAGYRQALDQGLPADRAIAAGDRAVRLSQMAAGPKDLAAVQRKDGLMKTLTLVYSYFNLLYNRNLDIGKSFRSAKSVGEYLNAFERTMFLIAIPAIVGPLVSGQGPGDDEDWGPWATIKLLTYPMMGVPGLRELGSAFGSGWAFESSTPLAPLGEALSKLLGLARKKIEGEEVEVDPAQLAGNLIDAVGYGVGLPTAQPKRTVKYLIGTAEGDYDPEGVTDWLRGVIFGPPKH